MTDNEMLSVFFIIGQPLDGFLPKKIKLFLLRVLSLIFVRFQPSASEINSRPILFILITKGNGH